MEFLLFVVQLQTPTGSFKVNSYFVEGGDINPLLSENSKKGSPGSLNSTITTTVHTTVKTTFTNIKHNSWSVLLLIIKSNAGPCCPSNVNDSAIAKDESESTGQCVETTVNSSRVASSATHAALG